MGVGDFTFDLPNDMTLPPANDPWIKRLADVGRQLRERNPHLSVLEAMGLAVQMMEDANPEDIECTGVTASWCPIHGDCTCPRHSEGIRTGEVDTEDPNCPLHAHDSNHPIEGPGS